jgi:regulator of cell morphogenesis and NO signaling
MPIDPQSQIAAIATAHPETIRVFQRHGIDFCCGGKRHLAEACAERGLAASAVVADLESSLLDSSPGDRDWTAAPLAELVEHIETRYHEKLREELPRLGQMADKVLRVHGDRHPAMVPPLAATLAAMSAEIASHLRDEEALLFPVVRALDADGQQPDRTAALAASTELARAMDGMEHEHVAVGVALARMRALSHDFAPPEGACNTFRGLFHGLEELERELHEHIHLENNILFPRARRAADAAQGSVASTR